MLALYRSGRQAEALKAYREARRILVDELESSPAARFSSNSHDRVRPMCRACVR